MVQQNKSYTFFLRIDPINKAIVSTLYTKSPEIYIPLAFLSVGIGFNWILDQFVKDMIIPCMLNFSSELVQVPYKKSIWGIHCIRHFKNRPLQQRISGEIESRFAEDISK